MHITVNQTVIDVRIADITEMKTDAIVNAANEMLAHGGGVAGAIVRKGGASIQELSSQWVRQHGLVATGTAAITGAGQLQARYVIHAVGPIMGSGDEDRKLREATQAALNLAEKYGLESISFPAISTGIFGYPAERCAQIMMSTVVAHVRKPGSLRYVIFCLFDTSVSELFQKALLDIESKL
jgi:O-acetyl-ADP-ribose deacetylase (regulator of RNase III)